MTEKFVDDFHGKPNPPKGEDYLEIVDLVMNLVDMIPSENSNVINPNELMLKQHVNVLLVVEINYGDLHRVKIQFEHENLEQIIRMH